MTCKKITTGDGVIIIACSRTRARPCRECGRGKATKLCDFPLKGSKAGSTCDAPLCAKCSVVIQVEKSNVDSVDLCPARARVHRAEVARG